MTKSECACPCPCEPDVPPGVAQPAIDVWLAFYDDIAEDALAGMLPLLSTDERKQQVRFLLEDDRKRYLVTRGMVRTVLSEYVDVPAKDWSFVKDDFGRPRIAGSHGIGVRDLSFNISHTRGLVAMAVTVRRSVGVDVEHLAVREVSMGVANSNFAAEEIADLACIPADRQQDRFFEYWTFKESYVKARGLGMSIPLDRFGFRLVGGRSVRLMADPALDDDVNRWRFWQYRPTRDHLMALCADVGDEEKLQVVIRRWVPVGAHAVLDLELLKAS